MKTIRYKLHASQYQVYSDPSRFIILSAGRRWGKTVLGLIKILAETFQKGNVRSWYIAPTYRQAEMIAWKMLIQIIPKALIKKKNEVKLELTLRDDSEIALKGADNEDSLRGAGLHYVVLDEYAQMKRNIWEEIVRPMLTDTQGKALFISTPQGKNNFWELWLKGERNENGFKSYRFKTEDNPYIAKSEIEEAKNQMEGKYFRQEYEASFEDYTGLIWPEFTHKRHLIHPFPLPAHWEKIGAIDPAITGTTACLFSCPDEGGKLYITGEYYQADKRVSEVASEISGKASIWWCDPSAERKGIERNGQLYSIFDEFRDHGIHPFKAQNDVNAGINRVAEYFKQDKIKIFSNCKNLIHELERYHWSEERETAFGMVQPKPYKSMDHACDCLRYLIMSRSESKPFQKKIEPESFDAFDWTEEKMRTFKEKLEEVNAENL